MDDTLIENTVHQTNLYAKQCLEGTANPRRHSYVATWTDVSATEKRQWLGFIFLTGLIKKNHIKDYWSTNPLHSTPIFPAVMTRNRYEAIKKFTHWTNNAGAPGTNYANHDRLYKIRPLLSHLSEKFQKFSVPSSNISINESLLLFKGRPVWKQFMPLKCSRFGIKIYVFCDSGTGYTYCYRIYTGAQEPATDITNDLPQECEDMLSSEKIVVWLLQLLLDKGYHLYIDNYYTSIPLATYLLTRNTHFTGTIRANRIPAPVKNGK